MSQGFKRYQLLNPFAEESRRQESVKSKYSIDSEKVQNCMVEGCLMEVRFKISNYNINH